MLIDFLATPPAWFRVTLWLALAAGVAVLGVLPC